MVYYTALKSANLPHANETQYKRNENKI